ncbi:hypothetical protein BX616_000722 [Lobosporangium transversale]|nr:hypothetical protein BX616_000722 [Lobosporangium transversale]
MGIGSDSGSGTGSGPGLGTRSGIRSGTVSTAPSRRSVHISIPDSDRNNNNDNDGDACSVSSVPSHSTYSSSCSCSAISSIKNSNSRHSICKKSMNGEEEDDIDDNEDEMDSVMSARQLFWTYVTLAPILLTIWAIFATLLIILPSADNETSIRWDQLGAGVIGWVIAFGSRRPIYATFEHLFHIHPSHCEWSTLFSAGVLEEVVRLVFILLLIGVGNSKDFGAVYWLGLGWAGVETFYYIGQSLYYSWSLSDDDYRAVVTTATATATATTTAFMTASERSPIIRHNNSANNAEEYGGVTKSTQQQEQQLYNDLDTLDSQSNEEVISTTREVRHLLGIDRPWWSLMGRTSSMMVHIGLSCWLGHSGWRLLAPAAIIHGILYVVWGVVMPDHWSVPATSYGTLMAAMTVFLIGLAFYGEIV